MSRAALIGLAALLAIAAPADAASLNPHVDPSLLRAGCAACHAGHGTSRSPMLAHSQKTTCMTCHDTRAGVDQQIARSNLAPNARPPLIGSALLKASAHPISAEAFSSTDGTAVVCTSCHAPHRGAGALAPPGGAGKRRSPRSPTEFEHELCERCHGRSGQAAGRADVARLLDPSNRSYHPVEAPASSRSSSVPPSLSGREINCTDCHGSDDPTAARGPHGSNVPNLLRADYRRVDGIAESSQAFALCYRCHGRDATLNSSAFPEHRKHIVELKTACATCHNAHGSVLNRALIRFGDEPRPTTVAPSVKSGRLAFVSDGAGSGACYLNCHGEEHGPKSYGAMRLQIGMIGAPRVLPVAPTIPTLPDPARERSVVRDRERMRP